MTTVQDIEKDIQKFWKDNNIPEKVRNKNKGKKKFYFLDGPPYATGYIHIGTAWNKILKDVYIRYWRMKGFDVWDQPGYDTHGLPIENKVEQKLGFKSKTDIENLGIKKFNQECRNYATQFIGIMNSQFENLGVWMNWEKPYLTLNNDYIEGAWHTFKMGFEKGLLYKDFYPVHVCPRCVDKDSVVLLNNYDTKTIGELEDNWQDRKIVATDIKNNTLISRKIKGYYNLGKELCFEIKTRESSKTLIATNDHPFWVKNKGWVPLEKICVGDKVAVYNHPDYSYNTYIRDDLILDKDIIIKNVSRLRKKFKGITKRFYALDDYKKEKIIQEVQKLREHGNSLRKIQSMVLSSYKVKISFGSILNIFNERKKKNITKNSIETLNKIGLLPLSLNNPKLPIVARILGHVFGDGSISVRKRGKSGLGFCVNFSGEESDLLRIKKDLKSLGFKSYKITKKISNSVINTRKIAGYSKSFRCESTSLALLLISLGAPVGKKSSNAFEVPKWILKAPDFIVREFLGAYFGSELDIIKPRDYGKG
ncbi:MAG: class I tRNA ligase family protein, partial [Fervidobacterium sp.]